MQREIDCPFCGEKGFDLVGLKIHLTGERTMFGEGCEAFEKLSVYDDTAELNKRRTATDEN